MSGIIGLIEKHTPTSPRFLRSLDLLLPLLVTALLVVNLVRIGEVSSIANEAQHNSEVNRVLVHKTAQLTARNKVLVDRIHQGIVLSCRRNGNPLRAIVRRRIEREVAQTSLSAIEEFFPTLPRDKLVALLIRSRRQNRKDIRDLAPVPCTKRYKLVPVTPKP